ncbi:MAG TPA: hypothetical protein VGC41_12890 [Kofleriaceae bacterium]
MYRIALCLSLVACAASPESQDPPGALPPAVFLNPPSASSVPTNPVAYTADDVLEIDGNWVVVPASYDATHQTPMTLLVWLHGCDGYGSGDIDMISPALNSDPQDWISLSVGGREGDCWDPDADMAKVTTALARLKTHFNVKPDGVVLGGYSSGGDLGYRLIFDHTDLFAGLIAENTSPFRDTGSTQAESLAAATWKVNILHLAHLDDTTYPIAGVRAETDAVIAAGFPLTRIERHGGHYDDANKKVYPGSSQPVPGTTADLQTYLLPAIDAGWHSP